SKIAAQLREELNERMGGTDLTILVEGEHIIIRGEVSSEHRSVDVEKLVRQVARSCQVDNQLRVIYDSAPRYRKLSNNGIRVAAIGDLHFDQHTRDRLRPYYDNLEDQADFLLLAGDLTQTGHTREATALA